MGTGTRKRVTVGVWTFFRTMGKRGTRGSGTHPQGAECAASETTQSALALRVYNEDWMFNLLAEFFTDLFGYTKRIVSIEFLYFAYDGYLVWRIEFEDGTRVEELV
ncbi:hypothetical protein COSMO_141 [Mycobacterium phage Cosmo]|uniref:Uncharacterized protein n=1 Tax=Mycobacterium phage Cosmo TaxID=1567467 RepID=A0A0B5A008_9CAUD|nr:hypothetical protein COSMO_141 [Mycobacterium phage Cosmo]